MRVPLRPAEGWGAAMSMKFYDSGKNTTWRWICSRGGEASSMTWAFPEWDQASPSASMRRTAEWCVEAARAAFLKDGTHEELFFLFQENGKVSVVEQKGLTRDQFATALKQQARAEKVFGIVHVVIIRVYIPRGPNDHTWIQLTSGEMRMSDLKHEDKTESILVHYKCRDGTQRAWISPIVRPKAGGVALGDALEMDETAEGRFASLF